MATEQSREKMRYLENASLMIQAVKTYEPPPVENQNQVFWIVIKPWHGSAVPWYAVALAISLQKEGKRVSLLWDDMTDNPHETTWKYENEAIKYFLSHFTKISVLKLSSLNPVKLNNNDDEFLQSKALASAIWINRSSLPEQQVQDKQKLFISYFRKSYPHIKSFHHKILQGSDSLVLPGGVYGNTALFAHKCEELNQDYFTYDGGVREVSIGINAPAAYFPSISLVVNHSYNFLTKRERDSIEKFVQEEIDNRMHQKDDYLGKIGYKTKSIQKASVTDDDTEYNFDVMFPLCIEWDSTALGRHQFFLNDVEWIRETVSYLLENTSCTIAVRQHPGERVKPGIGNRFEILLGNEFGDNPRLRFFSSDEPVSSYQIAKNCSIVLPSVSSFANEAAILGKKIITECRSYFSSGSFCDFISGSKENYFLAIRQNLDEKITLCSEQIFQAKLYYFFFLCRHTWGDFSPAPESFANWVQSDINQLFSNAQLKTILQTIIQKLPISQQVYSKVLSRNQLYG